MAVRMNKVRRAPATMEEALNRFIAWKKANGISDQTSLDYTIHINLFFKRFPDAAISFEQLERAVVSHLSQDGIKNKHHGTVKWWMKWKRFLLELKRQEVTDL